MSQGGSVSCKVAEYFLACGFNTTWTQLIIHADAMVAPQYRGYRVEQSEKFERATKEKDNK